MWPRFVEIAIGIWVMTSPAVLGTAFERVANHDYITGPIIVTFAAVALSEATRPCRWVVLIAGAWLIFAPFVLGHWTSEPAVARSDILAGCLAMIFPWFGGRVSGRYGGGWSALWRGDQARGS